MKKTKIKYYVKSLIKYLLNSNTIKNLKDISSKIFYVKFEVQN